MNKQEAKEAIEQGLKVRHRLFVPGEFIKKSTSDPKLYEDEEGVNFFPDYYWRYLAYNQVFNINWEIVE